MARQSLRWLLWLTSQALHSARYGDLARIFLAAFAACGEPTKLLELFLSAFSRGALKEAALPAGVSPAHLPPAGGAWRADAFDPRSFLHGSHPHELTQPFGPRLIAIWSAAISGRPILVSGGASARASLLIPLLAGFPTLSKHAYSRVFPALSSSAATAVSKGATPTTVAGADPATLTRGQRELLAPSAVKTGLVLGCGGGSDAAAWSSRREWWKCAAHLDTGVVVPAEGEVAWGLGSAAVGGGAGATAEGGSGDTFPSPLHAAVWRAVSEGLTSLSPDDGPATLWAFAKIWQGVNSTYILKPLAKVAEGGGGVLSRGALSNPDLGLPPSSANFLWEAAVALAAEGTAPFAVEGVSTA